MDGINRIVFIRDLLLNLFMKESKPDEQMHAQNDWQNDNRKCLHGWVNNNLDPFISRHRFSLISVLPCWQEDICLIGVQSKF